MGKREFAARRPVALVLDDDVHAAALVKLYLETLAARVDCAVDFPEFRRRLDATTDLVVLDLMMPETDGVEVLRYLSRERYDGWVTIVSAADADVLESVRALAVLYGLNVTGALPKPFGPDQLAEQVRRAEQPQPAAGPSHVHLVEGEIMRLVEAGMIRLHYQPKLRLDDDRVVGFEALVRCRHPELGLLTPASFLRVVEDSPLLEVINQHVFELAFRDVARWHADGVAPKIALNIAARSISDPSLPARLRRATEKHRIDPRDVTVEITETTFTTEMLSALEVLARLRLMGLRLSIDDFGTGYSTEDRLQQMPFTELKIDRGIVTGIADDPTHRQHLQKCIDLASRLGLTSVAEGVETEAQLDWVRRLGADQAQGYLIGEPMPAAEVPAWLRDRR